MLRLVPLTLLVVALALAAGVPGLGTGPLELTLSLLATALVMLIPPAGERKPAQALLLVAGVAAALLGLVLLGLRPDERVHRLLAFSVLLGGGSVAFRGAGIPRRTVYVAALAALMAGIFFLIVLYSPLAWLAWTRASLAVSAAAGAIVGRSLALGPSYSGFDVTALVLFAVLAVRVFTDEVPVRRTIGALVYVCAALVVYYLAMAFVASTAPAASTLSRHVPWSLPALLFLVQLPALWIAGRGLKLRPLRIPPQGARDVAWAATLGGALLIAAAALVVRPIERPAGPLRVVLYDKGFVNWASPDFQSFGEYSSGMLGRLPVFLRQLGFDAVVSPTLDDNALSGARVVVIFTPMERFASADRGRVYDFVRAGGGLLVVGEHTWLNDRSEDPLNDLLAPSDIRVNFDSAYYRIGGWLESYGYSPDPLYAGLRQDLNEPGVGIGASLRVGPRAVPLLWGTHAFSDAGSRAYRPELGNLGDSTYAPGEQLGDVVLAAEQRIGRGRLVVLGDTTPFFNLLMMGSHEMVARLFDKLASPPAPHRDLLRLIVALALCAGAAAAFFFSRQHPVVPVILAGIAVSLLLYWRQSVEAAACRPAARGRVAVVDASHANGFSRDTWRDDSLAGLFLTLMRNDVQPVMTARWSPDALSGARMLFIISPLRDYTGAETRDVVRFMDSGGTVVLSVDPSSAPAVAKLLDRFHLRVRNTPLGQFITNYEGGSVRLRVGYVVQSTDGTSDGIVAGYESLQTAVMVERRAASGRGRLLLIGDGQFFYNKNLEPEKGPAFMENVGFVSWLARRAMPPAPGATP